MVSNAYFNSFARSVSMVCMIGPHRSPVHTLPYYHIYHHHYHIHHHHYHSTLSYPRIHTQHFITFTHTITFMHTHTHMTLSYAFHAHSIPPNPHTHITPSQLHTPSHHAHTPSLLCMQTPSPSHPCTCYPATY